MTEGSGAGRLPFGLDAGGVDVADFALFRQAAGAVTPPFGSGFGVLAPLGAGVAAELCLVVM